uniref:Uncharacterized protein n=1 Tax=Peronospora matthiolae TaxID=2874970 RepID=A0AAV1TKF3_9STRA
MRRVSVLGVRLATLALLTQILMMTSATALSLRSTSGSEDATVAELLANVQAAVVDDPALANMFDISNASELSEEELTSLLRDLLTSSVIGTSSASASGSGSGSLEGSMERPIEDGGSATGPTDPSGSLKSCSLSRTIAVLATVAALGVALV